MKIKSLLLMMMLSSVSFAADLPTVNIEWQQPIYNVDGTSFPPEEISKFTVHYGMYSGYYNYQYDVPSDARVADIPVPYAGKWYIVATVTNLNSETSEYSNEVIRSTDKGPKRKTKPPKIRFLLR